MKKKLVILCIILVFGLFAYKKYADRKIYNSLHVEFTNEITINKNNLGVGTYYLYLNVTDNAGNKAELQQIRYNTRLRANPVAHILQKPTPKSTK